MFLKPLIGRGSTKKYIYSRAGGVPTRHTHKWDGLHTRHLGSYSTKKYTKKASEPTVQSGKVQGVDRKVWGELRLAHW